MKNSRQACYVRTRTSCQPLAGDRDSEGLMYLTVEPRNSPSIRPSGENRCPETGSRSLGSANSMVLPRYQYFVTRIFGNHELILLPLYALLQRYMGGHQRDVTAVLVVKEVGVKHVGQHVGFILDNFETDQAFPPSSSLGGRNRNQRDK